jgi:diguanylate cyclase (GGDEF)-like protein
MGGLPYGGSKAGATIAIFTAISLLVTNRALSSFYIINISPVYDSLVALFVYLFIGIIVTNFRKVHRVEAVAADTDSLTGVYSSRRFYAELAKEIVRSKRYGHAFSLAYIDVDNFKQINDTLGHSIGDNLLIQLSKCLLESLRATDVVARIGGDEFVCILPEAEQIHAKSALLKAEKALKYSMEKHDWDVSISIGVVTFETLPDNVREDIKLADELMYEVKNNGKNNIAYRVRHGV